MLPGCKLAGSGLGRKGIPAERVGSDAAQMLLRNLSYGCCVDEFLQDQVRLILKFFFLISTTLSLNKFFAALVVKYQILMLTILSVWFLNFSQQ